MRDIRKTQVKAIKNPTGGHYDYGRQGTSTTYILQKILTKLEESYHVFTTPTGFGSVFLSIFSIDLKIIVEALTTGGFTDWLWKSFAVCLRKVLKDLDIKKIANYKRQCYIPDIISIKL